MIEHELAWLGVSRYWCQWCCQCGEIGTGTGSAAVGWALHVAAHMGGSDE